MNQRTEIADKAQSPDQLAPQHNDAQNLEDRMNAAVVCRQSSPS